MNPANPMEDVFIQQVEQIVAKIFRDDTPPEELNTTLQKHLEKARHLKLLRYEGETLNALGILAGDDQAASISHYQAALDCAKQTDDPYLQVKLLNNIAASHRELFDYANANQYLDQSIALGRSLDPAALAVMFSFAMRADDLILIGDFKAADDRVNEALTLAQRVKVTGATRNDYGRGIYFLRVIGARAEICLGQAEQAHTSLELAQSLTEQLGIDAQNALNFLNRALYALLIDDDPAAYDAWYDKAITNYPISTGEYITMAMMLHHTGHSARAYPLAEQVLADDTLTDSAIRERVKIILAPVLKTATE